MKQFISEVRGRVTESFARSVAAKLEQLGMTTKLSVNKIGQQRLVDSKGQDLGDVDILAAHRSTRSIVAVEAKDCEIARTPPRSPGVREAPQRKKGKKSTVELHSRRLAWLRENLAEVVRSLGVDPDDGPWQVVGSIVTSGPLLTPLVEHSPLPVVPYVDLRIEAARSWTFAVGASGEEEAANDPE